MPGKVSNKDDQKITVSYDGPYNIEGEIPLVHKTQVVTEQGEPVLWRKDGDLETIAPYSLCRCGHSHEKPFCDGTHCEIPFDGSEDADTSPTADRRETLPGSPNIKVMLDPYLCMDSGFCANRLTNIEKMLPEANDASVFVQLIYMIENCPSGAYTYALKPGEPDTEPDFPCQIAVTTEMTSEGPIMGPLWVTGNIPVERADGKPFETRNRVTLCRCGRSSNKPLCDGSHRAEHVTED